MKHIKLLILSLNENKVHSNRWKNATDLSDIAILKIGEFLITKHFGNHNFNSEENRAKINVTLEIYNLLKLKEWNIHSR